MSQPLTERVEERMRLGGGERAGGEEGGRESNKIEVGVLFNQHSDNTKTYSWMTR